MKHYFLLSALSIALLFGAVERPPEAANAAPYLGTKVIATSFTFGQLRNSLEAAIEKSGMYVVTSASAGAGTKRRGIDIPGNPVLSVYRNDFAVLMLKASVPSGISALAIVAMIAAEHGWRMPVLVGLGGLLGLMLYHAAFGFTAAYRRLFVARETAAVRTQVIMIAVSTLLFAPTLAEARGFAIAAAGANAPPGTQVLVGTWVGIRMRPWFGLSNS